MLEEPHWKQTLQACKDNTDHQCSIPSALFLITFAQEELTFQSSVQLRRSSFVFVTTAVHVVSWIRLYAIRLMLASIMESLYIQSTCRSSAPDTKVQWWIYMSWARNQSATLWLMRKFARKSVNRTFHLKLVFNSQRAEGLRLLSKTYLDHIIVSLALPLSTWTISNKQLLFITNIYANIYIFSTLLMNVQTVLQLNEHDVLEIKLISLKCSKLFVLYS